MRDRLHGPDSASLRPVDGPWDRFERALAVHLRRPGVAGAMEFSAPTDSTGRRARCVLHLPGDASPAWVSYRSSHHVVAEQLVLTQGPPPASAPLARAVVEACRDRLAVPHPQLLTLRCEGPVRRGAERLALVRSGAVPIGSDPADYPDPVDVAVEVTDHEDVRERFDAIIERVTGRTTIVDDDGDLVFDHVGHPVHVSFGEDEPSARIWAWVVRGVRSRGDAAIELARLNREEEWTSWVLDGRHVLQRTTLSVGPFLPRHVQFSLERFLFAFATTHDGIAARLGPR